jgi:hypothetical protein
MLSIEILHRNHIDLIAALPQPVFARLVRSLVDGLDCVDNDVAMRASSAMDHLATHFVKNWPKDTPTAQGLKLLVAADQGIFAVLMRQLFKVLVLDEAPASAQSVGHMTALTLVRPLLPVILAAECVQPGALEVFKAELIASQPASLQPRALEEFNRFASGLTRCVEPRQRGSAQPGPPPFCGRPISLRTNPSPPPPPQTRTQQQQQQQPIPTGASIC